jgi:hypothetical protein
MIKNKHSKTTKTRKKKIEEKWGRCEAFSSLKLSLYRHFDRTIGHVTADRPLSEAEGLTTDLSVT